MVEISTPTAGLSLKEKESGYLVLYLLAGIVGLYLIVKYIIKDVGSEVITTATKPITKFFELGSEAVEEVKTGTEYGYSYLTGAPITLDTGEQLYTTKTHDIIYGHPEYGQVAESIMTDSGKTLLDIVNEPVKFLKNTGKTVFDIFNFPFRK